MDTNSKNAKVGVVTVPLLRTEVTATSPSIDHNSFIIDSGAGMHICNDRNRFTVLRKLDNPFMAQSFQSGVKPEPVNYVGKIQVVTQVNGQRHDLGFENVAYIPTACNNLLAAGLMLKKGIVIVPGDPVWRFKYDGCTFMQATMRGAIPYVDVTSLRHLSTITPTVAM